MLCDIFSTLYSYNDNITSVQCSAHLDYYTEFSNYFVNFSSR